MVFLRRLLVGFLIVALTQLSAPVLHTHQESAEVTAVAQVGPLIGVADHDRAPLGQSNDAGDSAFHAHASPNFVPATVTFTAIQFPILIVAWLDKGQSICSREACPPLRPPRVLV